MSTYWGYLCQDCEISSPHWINHGEDNLRDIYTHRAALIEVCDYLSCGPLNIEYIACYDDPMPHRFLEDHEGHHVVLQNEYGDTEEIAIPVEEVR